ncbi:centromere protein R [Erpetoichthys calabaricus]|uniref:centromere protein R n=1 Tax=Erpetoichthys calabaricus TaxID=27687 RepID=UPI00109F4527|nr:centromere protein R [Erpetoichthys calabaricus]
MNDMGLGSRARRSLQLENQGIKKGQRTPKKSHLADKTFSPVTGTRQISPIHTSKQVSPSKKAGTVATKDKALDLTDKPNPDSQEDRLHSLRIKVEKSLQDFEKAREQLLSLQTLEGSSELGRIFKGSSADIRQELSRNRQLMEDLGKQNLYKTHYPPAQTDLIQIGSSYNFLKSVAK